MTLTTVHRIRRLPLPERFDLARTARNLAVIQGDPTLRVSAAEVWWATRTPDGPGTLHLCRDGTTLVATAYGPGADWLLDRADAIAGLRDDVAGFVELAAAHPLVHDLARRHAGARIPATGRVFHHLVPAILGQKVTGKEAHHGYVRMVRHFGEPAPGPHPGVALPPDAVAVAATPYWTFHPFGVEQKRADTVCRGAAYAGKLESAPDAAEATRRLTTLRGIGPWTAAEVVRVAYGDPDAVSVGDYHIPNTVAWALAGEPRGDDARMLELLEPFRGHRGRVCLLLSYAGIGAPKFGPRMPIRSFARY
jgi:3-methyladenine DNA glycosylase/8-oxoguanine DNA glycosylase